MKKILYLFTILTLLIAGCDEDVISTFGSISGTVRDNIDNEPLSGVRVDIIPGGTSVITGNNGVFSFRDIESQDYTLNFSKEGYGSDTKKVTVVPGQNSDASVVLTQITPILKVTPQKLDFENEVTTLALDISNTGKGELEWSISEEIDWLSCQPTSGKTTNESSSVVVTVSRARLERGSYSGNIVISSNGGSLTIPVTISAGDIALKVEPTELDFGTLTNSLRLTLKNTGTKNISYQVESSTEWLVVNKKSGLVSQSDYIDAIVTRDGLSSGNYNANITITVNGSNIVVPVKMEVAVNAKPTVSMESVTNISYNSAVLHGSMVSVGSTKVTRHGFCYGEQPGVTIENSFTNLGNCSEPVALESTITNLKSETKYYVRAYAENSVGIVYSDKELSFTTTSLPTIPSVTTGKTSDITTTSAKVQGNITSLGNVSKITHYGHVWSKTAKPTLENGNYNDLGESNATKSFTSELTGLEPNTTYHVRAYANNEKGTAYGEEITFTTSVMPTIPSVTTGKTSDITSTSAKVQGNITSLGNISKITHYGHVWSKTALPTLENGNYNDLGESNATKSFTSELTGLESNTTYHVRAYATNEKGTAYGEEITFTTSVMPTIPSVTTGNASDITGTSARVQGNITSLGNISKITHYGHVWSKTALPTLENGNYNDLGESNATKSFTSELTGLESNTTYHVRAYATNEKGTAYGEDITFTTSAMPTKPSVMTGNVSDITSTSARVQGFVTSLGNVAKITHYGHVWGKTALPTIENDVYSDGEESSTTTSFTSRLTDLEPNTTYHVRAYATNEMGTAYGEDVAFTTEEEPVQEDYSSTVIIPCDDRIRVEIVSCKRTGTSIVFNFTLTNTYWDSFNDFRIRTPYDDKTSYIFDNEGNDYSAKEPIIAVGENSGYHYGVGNSLPKNLPRKCSVTIKEASTTAKTLTIRLACYGYGSGYDFSNEYIQFENLPIY